MILWCTVGKCHIHFYIPFIVWKWEKEKKKGRKNTSAPPVIINLSSFAQGATYILTQQIKWALCVRNDLFKESYHTAGIIVLTCKSATLWWSIIIHWVTVTWLSNCGLLLSGLAKSQGKPLHQSYCQSILKMEEVNNHSWRASSFRFLRGKP